MLSNRLTYAISIMALLLYTAYALFTSGVVGILLSIAVGFIVATWVDSIEILTATIILFGILYNTIRQRSGGSEGFVDADATTPMIDPRTQPYARPSNPWASGGRITDTSDATVIPSVPPAPYGTPQEIVHRLATISHAGALGVPAYFRNNQELPIPPPLLKGSPSPKGIFASFSEGFQDTSPATKGKGQADGGSSEEGEAGHSEPAGTSRANEVVVKIPPPAAAAAAPAAPAPPNKKPTGPAASPEAFVAPVGSPDTLFKPGELPTERREGPFLDSSSTFMKAVSSLRPDQIASMTADTQQYIEEQRKLVGMLQSMQPLSLIHI